MLKSTVPKALRCFKSALLWNNHFYGISIVALAMHSSLYLTGSFPSMAFLAGIYLATVLYYTNAYFNEDLGQHNQERVAWYQAHVTYLKKRQWVMSCLLLIIIIYSIVQTPDLLRLDIFTIFLMLLSSTTSVLYNHTNFKKNGIAKSIVIALVWTTVGGYLPIYFNHTISDQAFTITWTEALFLIQFFIFILLLAILFDIKDMGRDQAYQIQTIPIQIGLNHLMLKIVIPFVLIFICLDVLLIIQDPFSLLSWLLHGLFYYLVFWASKRAIKENQIGKSILLVDGLMLIWALLGIFNWYLLH